jgi:PhnB protein
MEVFSMRKAMLRSMMQVVVRRSDLAAALYQKAFNAKMTAAYPQDDGTFMHAELDVYGQILSLSELPEGEAADPGSTMMFCLDFGKGREALVQQAYDALQAGAEVRAPLGPNDYSPFHFCLIDRFGVNWCVFV